VCRSRGGALDLDDVVVAAVHLLVGLFTTRRGRMCAGMSRGSFQVAGEGERAPARERGSDTDAWEMKSAPGVTSLDPTNFESRLSLCAANEETALPEFVPSRPSNRKQIPGAAGQRTRPLLVQVGRCAGADTARSGASQSARLSVVSRVSPLRDFLSQFLLKNFKSQLYFNFRKSTCHVQIVEADGVLSGGVTGWSTTTARRSSR